MTVSEEKIQKNRQKESGNIQKFTSRIELIRKTDSRFLAFAARKEKLTIDLI